MSISRLAVFVEGESDEPVVHSVLQQVVPAVDHSIISFAGKPDLMDRLPGRLKGMKYLGAGDDLAVVVLVDRDSDDCVALLDRMERIAELAGLPTLASHPGQAAVSNRIAIEEMEAWLLGDPEAIRLAYPRVPSSIADRAPFRDPDGVKGGTAEALGRVLRQAGYMRQGFNKKEAASAIAPHLQIERNRSTSLTKFCVAVARLVGQNYPNRDESPA